MALNSYINNELDLLSTDSQGQLAHATITVREKRTTGVLNASTLKRTADPATISDTPVAVVGEPFVTRNSNDKLVRRVEFIVLDSDLTHRPSRDGEVVWSTNADGGDLVWRIVRAEQLNGAREWLLTGERNA